ncbi:MAG TPA: DUF2085 domain-containing protein [Thermomicrobiaceae bacterium]|nr:DUF2085 domain-containing protein [Thermomicrobiaceae bacterium]
MHPAIPRLPSLARSRRAPWPALLLALAAGSLAAFLAAPWPLEAKSMAVLHGLCSQHPAYSFWFDGRRLPFESRMTGIYGGCLCVQLTLLARGRFRAARPPAPALLAALALGIVAMGLDGLNSTLVDLDAPHLYAPSNGLRYLTGALCGAALAVFLWLLLGAVLWRPDARGERPAARWRDLALAAPPVALFGLAAASGWAPLYALLALALMLAAILVLFEFALPAVQLFRLRERGADSLSELAGPALAALLLSYGALLLLGGGRFALEAAFHLHGIS